MWIFVASVGIPLDIVVVSYTTTLPTNSVLLLLYIRDTLARLVGRVTSFRPFSETVCTTKVNWLPDNVCHSIVACVVSEADEDETELMLLLDT